MITRYIIQYWAPSQSEWRQSSEITFHMATASQAEEHMKGCQLRHPSTNFRVAPIHMTNEDYFQYENDEVLRRAADNILRQVVCSCGNYRHHGVGWMPEDSGEGLAVAMEIIRNPRTFNPKDVKEWLCDCGPNVKALRAGTHYCLTCGRMERVQQ